MKARHRGRRRFAVGRWLHRGSGHRSMDLASTVRRCAPTDLRRRELRERLQHEAERDVAARRELRRIGDVVHRHAWRRPPTETASLLDAVPAQDSPISRQQKSCTHEAWARVALVDDDERCAGGRRHRARLGAVLALLVADRCLPHVCVRPCVHTHVLCTRFCELPQAGGPGMHEGQK